MKIENLKLFRVSFFLSFLFIATCCLEVKRFQVLFTNFLAIFFFFSILSSFGLSLFLSFSLSLFLSFSLSLFLSFSLSLFLSLSVALFLLSSFSHLLFSLYLFFCSLPSSISIFYSPFLSFSLFFLLSTCLPC